ncbi:Uncharacterised protein [Mycobacteroides abscessus subsp. abscessus]|nr:Uncharacterised protein [Mycobacteroides abscessus subsp. abscessus]
MTQPDRNGPVIPLPSCSGRNCDQGRLLSRYGTFRLDCS